MSSELERENKDIIYRLSNRNNLNELLSHVEGVFNYVKQIYGNKFEKLSMYIGDQGHQQQPMENPEILAMFECIINEKDYDILLLTFLLSLSIFTEMQSNIANSVSNQESYRNWLRLLSEKSNKLLTGCGNASDQFVQEMICDYIMLNNILTDPANSSSSSSSNSIDTYRKHPLIERHGY